MTFSDKRIVDFVSEHFIPVWESVAPVTVAVFDLGDGRTIRGTQGGEIAIYFCRPDGKVFDILPALQSPRVTLQAIREAHEFYRTTGATDEAVRLRHEQKRVEMELAEIGRPNPKADRSLARVRDRRSSKDPATRALGVMAGSKTVMSGDLLPPMTVIEPGGLDYYRFRIHEEFVKSPLRTPDEWKEPLFVDILEQELKGGKFRYDADSLEPISIIEE